MSNISTVWSQFVDALKHEFLPADYNYTLLCEITNRYRRQKESYAEYVTQMLSAFKCLSIHVSEDYRLYLHNNKESVEKYSSAVGSHQITSINQLSNVCRGYDNANIDRQFRVLPFQLYSQQNDFYGRYRSFNRDVNVIEQTPDETFSHIQPKFNGIGSEHANNDAESPEVCAMNRHNPNFCQEGKPSANASLFTAGACCTRLFGQRLGIAMVADTRM